MGRIVLICPEPFRAVIQGVGIRFLEMATELIRDHEVTLWVPNTTDLPTHLPFRVIPFPDRAFTEHLRGVEVVLVHSLISERYFHALDEHHLGEGPPLAVDLYDPFLIEHLRYTRVLGKEIYYRDRAVLLQQLSLGDFFLCSSEGQRLFYVGMLMGMGRFAPEMYEQDRTLRTLIDVAPFGVLPISADALVALPGRLKGVLPGIAPDDVVLFFGGIYDWYDPELLLDALADLLMAHPRVRVIFSVNPNPESTPQGKFNAVRARADDAGWTNRQVFFIPWFPYHERFAYLKDVDLAVCLHEPSLETDLSLRTRVLDYMNAGIPVIATAGGEGGRILQAAACAILVPPGTCSEVRSALRYLLDQPEARRRLGDNGRSWVQAHMTWEKSLTPLLAFCACPRRMPHARSSPEPSRQHPPFTVGHILRYWRENGMSNTLRAAMRRLVRQ